MNDQLLEKLDQIIKKIDLLYNLNTVEYLTVEDAASFAKLSTQAIHKHKAAIGYSRPDRKVIIKKSDLIAWIENFRTQRIPEF